MLDDFGQLLEEEAPPGWRAEEVPWHFVALTLALPSTEASMRLATAFTGLDFVEEARAMPLLDKTVEEKLEICMSGLFLSCANE